jgi:mevalonate kinase
MVTVSVPGKVHLMGEHAVVYGKPALLAAIDKRLTVTISDKNNLGNSEKNSEYIDHILSLVQKDLGLSSLPDMTISIESKIPSGYHLGSSAAVAVGVTSAALYFLKQIWNPQRANQIAYESEKLKHGNPSGGDNTICTFGGLVWYRKEFEFLRSIFQLPFRIDPSLHNFFLIKTGKPKESTKEMIEIVRSNLESRNSKLNIALDDNEVQTKRITVAIKEGNEDVLVDTMRIGERTLETMGVVSDSAQKIIREIEMIGGGAKILGGGGKKGPVGYLLAYHRDEKAIQSIGQSYGYKVESVKLGEEGVRLESKD